MIYVDLNLPANKKKLQLAAPHKMQRIWIGKIPDASFSATVLFPAFHF